MLGQVEFYIRPALFHEWRFSLSLLPELIGSHVLPDVLFIALPHPESDNIVGVGAVIPTIKDIERPGFASLVRVVDGYRRQNVGRRLIQALADYAASWEVPFIHGWQSYPQGDESAFLLACGFEPYLNYYGFEVPRSAALDLLPLLDKYTHRGNMKEAYEFRPIELSPNADEVHLYSQHFLVSYDIAHHRLQLALGNGAASALSVSLYVNNVLQGYIIGYEDSEQVPKVDFWVTQRALSHTPIAMLLLCHFVKQAYDAGYERARFDCNDQARSTLRVAQRLNAAKIYHAQSYALSTGDSSE